MKKFTTAEIRDLYGQVTMGEISFSRMVEVLNERMEEPRFKEGDFVVRLGCIFILHKQIDEECTQYHVLYDKTNGRLHYYSTYYQLGGTDKLRLATKEEKQILLDALAKKGKRWNAEKLYIEDIPDELKKGDLTIFWEENKKYATIRIYDGSNESEECLRHKDNIGSNWKNAIKFESKEQYERLIKGEI